MIPRGNAVLFADDSPDDRFLMEEAWKQAGIKSPLVFVEDGEQVIDYLSGRGAYADLSKHARPALAILDIKMPKRSGLEALEWIRRSPEWKALPVIMLTASVYPGDISTAYEIHANAFLSKPTTAQELIELLKAIDAFWLRFNEFPSAP